jgi:hypothetical protein
LDYPVFEMASAEACLEIGVEKSFKCKRKPPKRLNGGGPPNGDVPPKGEPPKPLLPKGMWFSGGPPKDGPNEFPVKPPKTYTYKLFIVAPLFKALYL